MKTRQKKFRGKSRYYQKLATDSQKSQIDLSDEASYDFWHHHVDWKGRGNLSAKDRVAHLKALFTIFENVLEQVKTYKKPYQTWLSINSKDAYQDALFFHTPNPNQNNFPYAFPGFETTDNIPPIIRDFISDKYEVARLEENGQKWYVVRLRK